MNPIRARARMRELRDELSTKAFNHEPVPEQFFADAINEYHECERVLASEVHAKGYNVGSHTQTGVWDNPEAAAYGPPSEGAKAIRGKKWRPDSPLHFGEEQLKSLFVAGQQRLTGFTAKVGIETKGMGQWNIGTKQVGEGPPGSVLPPVLLPEAFQFRYEPARLFEHLIGARAESQSVTYLMHSSNSGAAEPVDELKPKPSLGMVITPQTVSFTTVAVLQSFSRQLADDFASWMAFVTTELTNAVIDQETWEIVNGDSSATADGNGHHMTGLLHVSGTLSRPVGSDTPIDAVVKSFNDIRVGPAFGEADLCVMHPSTWTFLRTQKDTQGRYLLALNQPNDIGSIDNVFGVDVLTNTKVPVGTMITLDTKIAVLGWTRLGLEVMLNQFGDYEFQNNALTYRVEERIAIGVQRPAAVCVVTGITVPGS